MTEQEIQAVKAISEAAEVLGWQIIFNSQSDDVKYIIIADPEVADELVDKLEK